MSNLPPPLSAEPITYASAPLVSADDAHLRLLAIFHYIWGGITAVMSSLALLHVGLGITMIANPNVFPPAQGQPPPPAALGWMFLGMGGCILALGWTLGGLTIYSGRCIARRRHHTFSLVMAGINCLSIPLGTTLGIFTFVVLVRESVKSQYAYRGSSVS